MLVGICGQLLDAGQDLRQNGINLVILTKVITELCKKRRKEEGWERDRGGERGRDGGGMEEGWRRDGGGMEEERDGEGKRKGKE